MEVLFILACQILVLSTTVKYFDKKGGIMPNPCLNRLGRGDRTVIFYIIYHSQNVHVVT